MQLLKIHSRSVHKINIDGHRIHRHACSGGRGVERQRRARNMNEGDVNKREEGS